MAAGGRFRRKGLRVKAINGTDRFKLPVADEVEPSKVKVHENTAN